ncbi:MAG: hypothetical protein E7434_08830 [Ruminococcaceae bacterium]|nr:hypothetical protein [Oscillospiraceae bacterium]
MFKLPKEAMTERNVLPTWKYLVSKERALKRNILICRIIQPIGALLFMFNLLITSFNFWLYFLDEKMAEYFMEVPILPFFVESMPRSSLSSVIVFTLLIAFVVPLLICGLIAGIFYLIDYKKNRGDEPLNGNLAQCAQALTNKAENLYELRKKIPHWSIYAETGILTVLTAVPLVLMFIDYAADGAMALQLVLIALALLVTLFVLFWVYALLFTVFARVNALYYLSPSEWKLYELYQQLDAYWEAVDPAEFARRQHRAEKRK